MRRNPPLSQHMAEDSLTEISKGLAQRLYDDPSEGAEFVRDCLRAVTSGLGDRPAQGEYEQKKEIATHLHEAWKHINDALALMHPRSNPHETEALPLVHLPVQTLLLSRDVFETPDDALAWAEEHGFKATKIDETENYYRVRQLSPSRFAPGTMRTIELRPGVKAVIGLPISTKASSIDMRESTPRRRK